MVIIFIMNIVVGILFLLIMNWYYFLFDLFLLLKLDSLIMDLDKGIGILKS